MIRKRHLIAGVFFCERGSMIDTLPLKNYGMMFEEKV